MLFRSPYKKQLLNNQAYYQKNKEAIIERVKLNQSKIPKEEINRKRILYYLNGDETYSSRIKPETIQKYSFKKDKNERWI